jgi:hypothetical protein
MLDGLSEAGVKKVTQSRKGAKKVDMDEHQIARIIVDAAY